LFIMKIQPTFPHRASATLCVLRFFCVFLGATSLVAASPRCALRGKNLLVPMPECVLASTKALTSLLHWTSI
jgi:hypothetical protein